MESTLDVEAYEALYNFGEWDVQISKVGGGTHGQRYEGLWEYAVWKNDQLMTSGADLHTGTPKTHYYAALEALALLTEEWQATETLREF